MENENTEGHLISVETQVISPYLTGVPVALTTENGDSSKNL